MWHGSEDTLAHLQTDSHAISLPRSAPQRRKCMCCYCFFSCAVPSYALPQILRANISTDLDIESMLSQTSRSLRDSLRFNQMSKGMYINCSPKVQVVVDPNSTHFDIRLHNTLDLPTLKSVFKAFHSQTPPPAPIPLHVTFRILSDSETQRLYTHPVGYTEVEVITTCAAIRALCYPHLINTMITIDELVDDNLAFFKSLTWEDFPSTPRARTGLVWQRAAPTVQTLVCDARAIKASLRIKDIPTLSQLRELHITKIPKLSSLFDDFQQAVLRITCQAPVLHTVHVRALANETISSAPNRSLMPSLCNTVEGITSKLECLIIHLYTDDLIDVSIIQSLVFYKDTQNTLPRAEQLIIHLHRTHIKVVKSLSRAIIQVIQSRRDLDTKFQIYLQSVEDMFQTMGVGPGPRRTRLINELHALKTYSMPSVQWNITWPPHCEKPTKALTIRRVRDYFS